MHGHIPGIKKEACRAQELASSELVLVRMSCETNVFG